MKDGVKDVARGAVRSGAAGYSACLAGFLLCVVAFYPGYLSPDSIRQLAEGRAWSFTDWHPPLMAAVWGVLDRIVPGPFGMLLLHNAAFWGALALFWRATYRRSAWLGAGLLACAFLPPVLALLSTVWKDVGLGAALLLASALLYTAACEKSRAALLLSLPFLFYGFGVRHNSPPAVLPLALWWGFAACRVWAPLAERAARRGRVVPLGVGLACFLLLAAAALLTTSALTGGRSVHLGQVVMLHDLTAVSVERGEPLFPDYVLRGEGFSREAAAARYDPGDAAALFRGEGAPMRLTEDAAELAALRAKWLEVLAADEGAYLRHRREVFARAAALGVGHVCFPYLATSHAFGGYQVNDLRVHRLLRAVFWKLRDTLLFRGYVWLLLSLAVLCASAAGRLRGELEAAFVLSSSGLLYGLAYFFVATACDFRFFWWTMLSALVSLCLACAGAARRWKGLRRAPDAEESTRGL